MPSTSSRQTSPASQGSKRPIGKAASRRNAAGGLDLFPNQSSGVLTSAVWGDGLVDNPAGTTIARGDLVSYLSFADLLL